MVKVRIAPSPTGNLHIGTARTALFNWLFAKKHGGEFILRIEDTDLERSNKQFENDIIEGLKWLGLDWSNTEIYRQIERLDKYGHNLNKLLGSGKAFWCDHSKEELEAEQKEQTLKKEAPRHLCSHKKEKRDKGQIIRLAVDAGFDRKISFEDKIRGKIEFEARLLGDFSLAKEIKTPLYNFAVVVDDIDMDISHVIRGEDHISNTPKQMLIYEALGEKPPIFAHLPLILGSDRSKMSKRHGATSINEYKKDYLPEAINNFMGYLGYTYNKEIMSKEEMAQEFELEKVHKSGAIFDSKKLNWINSQYIKNIPAENFKKISGISELPTEAVPLVTERLEKLTDVSNFNYFWEEPRYEKELLKWKRADLQKSLESLAETKKIIEGFSAIGGPASGWNNGKDELRKILDEFSKKLGDPAKSPNGDSGASRGLVYWPLRVALSGKDKSPDPVDIAFAIGKEKTVERIQNAIKKLES